MTYIEISAVQPPGNTIVAESVVQSYTIVVEGLFPQYIDGGGGGGSVPVDTELPVNTNGQTQFNIFTMPIAKTELIVNHALYQETEDYSFGTSGSNVVLIWGNEFPISTSDSLIFRKY